MCKQEEKAQEEERRDEEIRRKREYEDEEDEEEGDKKEGAPDAVEHGGGELPPEPRLVRQGDVAQQVVRLAGEALHLQGVKW